MEWPTKILKGSSNVGQYYGKYGDDRTWDELLSSEDDSSGFDKEEIDCAIALSLSEVDQKGKEIEYESDWEEGLQCIESDSEENERKAKAQQEEDEQLARAQQEEDARRAKAQVEEDEQLARAQQKEDARRAKAQVEEDEQLAKAIQEISNEYESDLEEDSQCIESDSDEDERQAKARQEEDDRRARAQQEVDARRAEAQVEEDEQLAKAIEQSLSMDSPPRYDNANIIQPFPFFFPSSYRICSGCNTEIGHGQYLSCRGAVWHPECCRCHACNQPITDIEFSMSKNHPYHKYCYKEQHHPKCDVCHNFIPTNSAGLIEYRAHPFWMQKYCPSHERDGTTQCCSCERMESGDTKQLLLDDGRKLCLECLDSAILDTHECQPLFLEMQGFYEGLNMKLEQQVPLLLVERQALNEAMEGEKNGHHHLPETRGLCLSEEQTVTMVLRKPRIGTGNRLIDMITEPHRLIRRCEVTAILILYGLPRLLTGSILAHEMMHAWLRLKGYPNLKPEVEEGICQVLAHMWLESEIYSGSGSNVASSSSSSSASSSSTSSKKGKRSDFEKDLGKFFKHQIESDSSSAYGDGFREGNKAVNKYGLRNTLDHIRMTGSFPC